MANLGKVIYINEEDYSTLLNGGSITKGGTTYTYDSTALYVIKDVNAPEYAETAGYATSAGQATKATQDGSGNNIVNTYARKVYDDSNSDENYVSRGDTLEECITALDTSIQNNYDYHEGQLQNKADKLKNIVIVKSGTSPNYTYSLPSGVTAASIATDITTNGTTVVLSLDNEIYYYDHTTGSSSSTILHFKHTDTTADGIVEKDLAIAYSNNAVTLTTTEYNEKLLPAVPNNHGDIIFSDLPYLNTGTPLSTNFPVVDAPANAPFAKCFGAITAYKTYTSDYIPVSPNDFISGEIWAYRASGATGTAGYLYCGINRFDRNKKPITSSDGVVWSFASSQAVPTDGVWHKYSGTTTIPTTHTAYNGSDGQGAYYIQFRVFVNYNSGTIPTYIGGCRVINLQSAKEVNIVNCGTNDVNNYANTENVIRAYHFDGTAPNNMPHADNANAVIDIDTYRGAGNYNHQVGFSGNGSIYHRTRSNTSFSSWKKIGYSTDSINSNDIVLDINTWAVNDEIEKKGFYFSSIHNTLYAADKRYVVTHKIFSSTDDSFIRNANSSNIFMASYPSDVNGAAKDNEYGVLYIGTKSIDEVTTSGASNSMATYGQGYIILSFYASHYSPSVTGRVWSGNSNAWLNLTFTRHQYTYIAYTNAVYPKALEITYQGITYSTNPPGAAVAFVEWYHTRPSLEEFPIVTKYAVNQNLYGNVTAPKFITRGGTSSQFVKGDGSLDSTAYAPLASPALTGTPTAPTAASGTNTTQVATTAFVQDALSNMGAGGSEMVDVTITGTTSSASFSTNPYNAIKAVVDDGKIAVLNASVAPLSATGVLIPVYEYTYSLSGSDYTGYKGKIQNGNYEISVDVQSTSSATVTITELQSGGGTELITATTSGGTDGIYTIDNATYTAVVSAITNEKQPVVKISVTEGTFFVPMYRSANNAYRGSATSEGYTVDVWLNNVNKEAVVSTIGSSVEVDDELSESSTNPVQNAVITAQILENEEIVATALNNLNDRVELKQDQLVSGTTIKTINNQSILGSGNITISGGGGGGGEENVIEVVKVNGTALTPDANKAVNIVALQPDTAADLGQGTLTATNSQGFDFIIADEGTSSEQTLQDALDDKQASLVSGTNIKTIDSNSIIGSGDLTVFPEITYSNLNTLEDLGIYRVGTSYICICTSAGPPSSPFYVQTLIGEGNIKTRSGNSLPLTSSWTITTYSKPSTGIPATDLASAVQTSLGKADTALQSYTETDPVFAASAAYGITAQDISNWNAKQNSLANTQNPYTAKGTSTKVPTITTNNLGQVTTITETDIAFPTLSKGTTSGSGNAVTDISVSGHTITLTKGSTFGTYSKPSGGIPVTDLATAVSQRLLPEGNGSTDDGKIVQYSYMGGGWQLVKPITIYTGSSAPSSNTGSNGDIYIQTS